VPSPGDDVATVEDVQGIGTGERWLGANAIKKDGAVCEGFDTQWNARDGVDRVGELRISGCEDRCGIVAVNCLPCAEVEGDDFTKAIDNVRSTSVCQALVLLENCACIGFARVKTLSTGNSSGSNEKEFAELHSDCTKID